MNDSVYVPAVTNMLHEVIRLQPGFTGLLMFQQLLLSSSK